MTPQRVAVILAGAGARGAYEAGVLAELLPYLDCAGSRPALYVGTSAGALNATMLASTAHLSVDEQVARLLRAWRSIRVNDVLEPLARTTPLALTRWAGQRLAVPGLRLHGVLGTRPLARTVGRLVDWPRLRANLDRADPAALAVVATSAAGTGRSVVFVDGPGAGVAAFSDDSRPIDYSPAVITPGHLLASAAIPVLFPPVRLGPDWFLDGGVRLNTPIKPALALGADAVVVIATHPAVPPPRSAEAPPPAPPDVDDCVVQLLDVAMVDPMIEDLRTLMKINRLAAGGYRVVPFLFCGPPDRASLGELATTAYGRPGGLLRSVLNPDLPLFGVVLGSRGTRRGDLLSYLLFEPGFIDAAIEAGRRDAARLLGDAADRAAVPWCTTAIAPLRRAAAVSSVPVGRATASADEMR